MALTHTPDEPAFGTPATDFDLPGVDGEDWSLQRCRGPAGLLLMFICNHCPYVKAILPRLLDDCRQLQAIGIAVAAISSNDASRYPQDGFAAMRTLATLQDWPFPYLYDESQTVARAYGAVCTPDFFGFDADLRLRYRGRLDAGGLQPRTPGMRAELVEAMTEIAAGRPVSAPQQASMGCSIKWRD